MSHRTNTFKDFIGKISRSDFASLSVFLNSSMVMWLGFLLLVAVTTLVLTVSLQRIPTNLKEGMIAARNIKANHNYEIVDEEATQKFREEATSGIVSIYDFDSRVADGIVKRVHEAFLEARQKIDILLPAEVARRGVPPNISPEAVSEIEALFSEKLGITLTPSQLAVLLGERFSDRVETDITALLRKAMIRPIVAERSALEIEKGKGIVLRKVKGGVEPGQEIKYEEKIIDNVSNFISTEEARRLIGEMPVSMLGLRLAAAPSVIVAIAQLLLEPNCSYNRNETDLRRVEAALNVKNVILKVNAGEMIIREGSRYEPWHIKVLRGIQKERSRGVYAFEFWGVFFLVFLILVIPFYLVERFYSRITVARSDYLLMAVVGLSVFGIVRVALLLTPALHDALFFTVASSYLNYAIPIAAGAMLVRMFLNAEIAFVFSVIMGLVSGFLVEMNIQFIVYSIICNLAAAIAIANTDKRSQILKAGVATGVVGAIAILFIRLQEHGTVAAPMTFVDIMWSMFFAFTGGIGSSIFTMIAAPLVESVSNYTSDIKLLELANLNHPILRELIVRAPGTYHHSHMVGILGEAAAEAIGANALLVRVGAYYHDIGKMKKPQYFIENARAGENKHDKLSPHMSSLIIAAHVKDGVEMAEKAKIPKSIIDIIPEHHGTRLIGYFFEKAKEIGDSSLEKIDSKDFVYPGPKPQTREAAILMLSDAVEAAVRALKEKSTTRISQTVQRVINDIFTEHQLDECELTLKDLNNIARAFMRILLGIYHARIEYPKDSEFEKSEVSIVEEGVRSESVNSGGAGNLPSESKKD